MALVPLANGDFGIDVPGDQLDDIPSVRRRVESSGSVEQRLVATSGYDADGVSFDLAAERKRLRSWLDAGGRQQLDADLSAIDTFAAESPHLRWVPRRILSFGTPDQKLWARDLMSRADSPWIVPTYSEEEWNGGSVPAHLLHEANPQLVELLAVNLHAEGFDESDMDRPFSRAEYGHFGGAVRFRWLDSRVACYREWARAHVGSQAVHICSDRVVSRFVVPARVHEFGIIRSRFDEVEAQDVAQMLRTGPLAVLPRFVRQDAAGRDPR